ncbi:MAG: hypothetical protein CMJ29_11835 [Phycisphaerae bacterium]|nr:hypothetical protein [Phycisphaerae bacterium]|tara:strand:+ start:101 stop:1402 length:1302 start_codon:yes stop_codon:yes gene_type:complete
MSTDHVNPTRRLSFLESTFQVATTQIFSSPIYTWATARGLVNLPQVAQAMRILHQRHPLLRARIAGEPGHYRFVTDVPIENIPLKECKLSEGDDINNILEPHMNKPLTGEDRTWGVLFVQGCRPDQWWLIVETHHAITDGRSAFHLLDQFGHILGDLVSGADIEIAALDLPAPIEHQLDPPGSMDHWLKTGEAWAEKIGEISHWPIDSDATFEDRCSCNTFTVHDEAFTRKLADACHAHGTTIQGAMAAASAMSISAHLGHAVNIDTITPVDLRRFAAVDIDPREVACKVICLDTGSFNVSKESDPWEIARAYKTTLGQQLEEDFYPPLDFNPEDVITSIDGWKDVDGRHTHGFSITNTGLLPFDGDYGPVQFEEVDITATLRFGGFPLLLSVYTYRHKLRCTYSWTQPTLSRSHALQLSRQVESHLRSMTQS